MKIRIVDTRTFALPMLLLSFWLLRCDTNARVRYVQANFTGGFVTNGVPKDPGQSAAICAGGDPSQLVLSLALRSDRGAVRPGDNINKERIHGQGPDDPPTQFAAGAFTFSNVCIKQSGVCSDVEVSQSNAALNVVSVDYFERRGAEEKLGLVILLDHSGSITGAINHDGPVPVEAEDEVPDDNYASDRLAHRITALKEFVSSLPEEDRVIIFSFNSKVTLDAGDGKIVEGVGLQCILEASEYPNPADRLKACFSSNKDAALEALDHQDLKRKATGRTPLWAAVKFAVEFLQGYGGVDRKQVLVVSDGPDTCAVAENPCGGNIAFDAAGAVLTPDIPVHFVQFPSHTASGRDLQQLEAACLSGGEYIYLNASDFMLDGLEPGALTLIRFMLDGTWRLFASLTAISDGSYPNGNEFGVQGILEIRPISERGEMQNDIFAMHLDQSGWDRRLFLFKP